MSPSDAMDSGVLHEVPFDATRLARLLVSASGAVRVSLVDTSTGEEFGSVPLADRSREELARVVGIVLAMRERLASPQAEAPVQTTPRETAADGWEVARPGDTVRWTPSARLAAKGIAPVQGVLSAPIRVASTTRFAKVDTGADKPAQVWENQGTLAVVGAASTSTTAPRIAEFAPMPRAGSPTPRKVETAPPVSDLDAAGLATPKRITPAAAWKGPPEAVKTLQAIETVMPLLAGDRRYDPARKMVALFRAWLETGVDRRDSLKLSPEAWDAMFKSSPPPQWLALNAVRGLSGSMHRGLEHAYDAARRLATTLRFDASGGNYAERLATAFKNAMYLRWYVNNPRFDLPTRPSADEAVQRVVEMATQSSEGSGLTAPEARKGANHYGSDSMRGKWETVADGHTDHALREQELLILTNKGYLLDEIAKAERTGIAPERTPSSLYSLANALDVYRDYLLFDTAWRAGLRSPTDAARPIMEARVKAILDQQDAVVDRLGPRVDVILRRAGEAIMRVADAVPAAFATARNANRDLRVPQTADVAELLAKGLRELAATLVDPAVDIASRLYRLEWIASERWTGGLRPRPGGGWMALVPRTSAAYVGPTNRVVQAIAEEPASRLAIRAIHDIGYDDAVALAHASRLRDHYRHRRDQDDPWWTWESLFREPYAHNIDSRWKGFAEATEHPPSYWLRRQAAASAAAE